MEENPDESHHEEFLAYNEAEGKEDENDDMNSALEGGRVKNVPCKTLWRNMDNTVIKPFLIYNYTEKSYKEQM